MRRRCRDLLDSEVCSRTTVVATRHCALEQQQGGRLTQISCSRAFRQHQVGSCVWSKTRLPLMLAPPTARRTRKGENPFMVWCEHTSIPCLPPGTSSTDRAAVRFTIPSHGQPSNWSAVPARTNHHKLQRDSTPEVNGGAPSMWVYVERHTFGGLPYVGVCTMWPAMPAGVKRKPECPSLRPAPRGCLGQALCDGIYMT